MVYESSKRIYKEQFGKILSILSIICGLVIFCTSTAFADDDMSLLTEQGLLDVDPVSVNDTEPFSVQDKDAMIHQVADKIVYDLQESGLLSDSGVKAQDYVYSIYQYLQSTIHPDLTGIKNTLQNGIYVDTSNIDVKLGNILQVLYGGATSYPSASSSIWYYLNGIYGMFIDGSLPSGGYGILAQLPLIEQNLHTASGVSVATSAAAIQSAIGTTNTTLSTISSRVNTTNTRLNTVNTNLTNIQGSLDSLYDVQFNDVTSSFNYIGCNTDIEDAFTNQVVSHNYVFFKIQPTVNLGGNVIRIRLPYVFSNYSVYSKAKLYYKTGVDEYENDVYEEVPTLTIINNGQQLYLYNLPNQMFKNDFIIGLYNEYEVITTSTSSTLFKVEYIGQDNLQSWYVREALSTSGIERMLSIIKNEVASDDIVQAKKESQPQIDEALDGFTGSGSGAAKVSDISGAKGVSSALQSGLSTGESSASALTAFSPANAFYGWFSQDNANYFTIYTPSRSLDNWDNIVWTDDEVILIPIIEQDIYTLIGDEK